jgi:hypothetical protein
VKTSYRVSADIGGTFTDIVYQDVATGRCGATKVLSTPDNPALAVLKGIDQVLGDNGELAFFVPQRLAHPQGLEGGAGHQREFSRYLHHPGQ